jgi:hypothetical protein
LITTTSTGSHIHLNSPVAAEPSRTEACRHIAAITIYKVADGPPAHYRAPLPRRAGGRSIATHAALRIRPVDPVARGRVPPPPWCARRRARHQPWRSPTRARFAADASHLPQGLSEVSADGEETELFLILRRAAQEYGYAHRGPLHIPCPVAASSACSPAPATPCKATTPAHSSEGELRRRRGPPPRGPNESRRLQCMQDFSQPWTWSGEGPDVNEWKREDDREKNWI